LTAFVLKNIPFLFQR